MKFFEQLWPSILRRNHEASTTGLGESPPLGQPARKTTLRNVLPLLGTCSHHRGAAPIFVHVPFGRACPRKVAAASSSSSCGRSFGRPLILTMNQAVN
eukprot:CAMPEP_0179911792 /NCGR_PEP_ID=MMETSP0982-20121206/46566_1 /TAXON_ID=483367 /ORGANISM="non described non described, Strain CCMP 2436" /LENGTH=97 /DNA_ID=CAMNT_0021813589 /DNA_START=629 /DNA_END=919 /DNA_ORIENTATION=+